MKTKTKAETFRRNKLLRWVKIQATTVEDLMRVERGQKNAGEDTSRSEGYIQARADMLESLYAEFGITMDEIAEDSYRAGR